LVNRCDPVNPGVVIFMGGDIFNCELCLSDTAETVKGDSMGVLIPFLVEEFLM
jgi:hypothetical protein